MAAKSITKQTDTSEKSNSISRGLNVLIILFTLILFFLIIITSSCSTPTLQLLPSATIIPSQAITITPCYTFTPTSADTTLQTETPIYVSTPISKMLISKGENVFQPIDSGVALYDTFGDLPSGTYVIRRAVDSDIHKEVLSYASLETSQQGILLSLDKILNLEGVFFDKGMMRILGGYPRMPLRYLFDLDNQNAFQFPLCNDQHPVEPSPSGRRLALICTERGEIQDGKVVIEIISLEDGMDYYLQIPYQSNKRNSSNKIFWVSDESFIAMVGPIEEPCLINITNPSMKCARALEGKPIQAVSNSWLVVNRSRGYRWIIDIHLMECFTDQSKCDTVATFDHEELGSASFHWAPNTSMLGVIFSADMGSGNTEVGYYDTDAWEYHQLVELPGDYLFVDWCPDSSCLLVRENAETTGYFVYIDKHLEPLAPDGFPMKLIEIP